MFEHLRISNNFFQSNNLVAKAGRFSCNARCKCLNILGGEPIDYFLLNEVIDIS